MIHGKCGYQGCQYDIKPGETQAKFNRNRGVHMRSAHGIVGAWKTGKKAATLPKVGKEIELPPLTAEPTELDIANQRIAHRRAYQAEYRARKSREREMGRKNSAVVNNKEAKLKFICPECGCRVFTTPAP